MAKKFCTQCNSKGVRHKKVCPTLIAFKEIPKVVDPTVVSKAEFDGFKNQVDDNFTKIIGLLQDKKESAGVAKAVPSVAAEVKVPLTHEEVFSKYFDREDGFDCEIDVLENTFTIIVPPKHSNASPAHKEYYPVDKRLIKMDNNNPLGTVEEYCSRVARNLRYDKSIKTK